MASVYDYTNYRKWLCDQAKELKKHRPGWTLSRLAEKIFVQAPYLTNVLKEKAHLNQDQLFLLSKVFTLDSEETEYLFLLLECERSGNHDRKYQLQKKIDSIRESKLKADTHLKAQKVKPSLDNLTKFYMSPEMRLTYAMLGIEKYRKNIDLISEKLFMAPEKVSQYVKELTELGLIETGPEGIKKTKKSLHLPKDSPVYTTYQQLLKYRSLQHQQYLPEEDKFNFSVVFTANEETKEKIQKEFFKFLSTAEAMVQEAPSEGAYHMTFDLFPWAK